MENKASPRQENTREKSVGTSYLLFDEKIINWFLYGTKEVRVIDVNKLKRKAENDQESSCSKKQKIAADHEKPQLTNAIRSFPDEVQLCMSSIPGARYGVCAKEHIPLGTWIGPYEGRRITPQYLTPDIDSSYLWEIFKDGKLSHYLDGSDEDNSSWMRFIRCARHPKEQNLYAFQYCGNIFYRAFKEIPPGKELLVWYDDKYPQFLGIPLGMQDYEFNRESVTSSNSRGSPKISSTSTQVTLSPQDPPKYVIMESRENLHTGHFRVPSSRAVQPRITRPTSSAGSSFGRAQFGPPAVGRGPRFAELICRTETSLTPTSTNDRQSMRISTQRPLSFDNNLYPTQTRRKDLPKTEQELTNETLKCKAIQGHASSKQLKPQAGMAEIKDSMTTNNRGLPQRTALPPEVTRSQLIDNDQQVSPRASEGQAVKPGKTSERSMPALHPHLPQAPPLHRINQFYYEPVQTQTSGISSDEFDMWRCRQCLKTFTQRVSLQMHACSRTPEKPYQCGQCKLSFATPADLRSHVDLHINDKLYKCGFCSRAFSGATTLNNHIRTHTGEKPFNCVTCYKTFSQASHLARHQRVPGECAKNHSNQSGVKSTDDS